MSLYKLDRSTFIIFSQSPPHSISVMHTYVVDIALDEVVGLLAVVEVPAVVVEDVSVVVTRSTNNVNDTIMI